MRESLWLSQVSRPTSALPRAGSQLICYHPCISWIPTGNGTEIPTRSPPRTAMVVVYFSLNVSSFHLSYLSLSRASGVLGARKKNPDHLKPNQTYRHTECEPNLALREGPEVMTTGEQRSHGASANNEKKLSRLTRNRMSALSVGAVSEFRSATSIRITLNLESTGVRKVVFS